MTINYSSVLLLLPYMISLYIESQYNNNYTLYSNVLIVRNLMILALIMYNYYTCTFLKSWLLSHYRNIWMYLPVHLDFSCLDSIPFQTMPLTNLIIMIIMNTTLLEYLIQSCGFSKFVVNRGLLEQVSLSLLFSFLLVYVCK